MTSRRIEVGGVQLVLPEAWQDLTEELETPDTPYTFADPDNGLGAFQLSAARYSQGALPQTSTEDLLTLLRQWGAQRHLGPTLGTSTFTGDGLLGAAADFQSEGDFIRAWYVSDGRNLALLTYVCEWGQQTGELPICENIVRSLHFPPIISKEKK